MGWKLKETLNRGDCDSVLKIKEINFIGESLERKAVWSVFESNFEKYEAEILQLPYYNCAVKNVQKYTTHFQNFSIY